MLMITYRFAARGRPRLTSPVGASGGGNGSVRRRSWRHAAEAREPCSERDAAQRGGWLTVAAMTTTVAAVAAVVVVAAAAQHAWQHRRPSVRQSVNRCTSGVVSVSVSPRARVTGSSAWPLTLRVFTYSVDRCKISGHATKIEEGRRRET